MGVVRTLKKPICPKGHDKRETGVYAHGHCVECRKQRRREAWARERRGHPRSNLEARYIPKLREYRIEMGLTQSEFASLIGVTASAVSLYELGKRRAQPYVLRKILAVIAGRMRESKEAA
jgi:DNA-binding XRE family transcriptional regulator